MSVGPPAGADSTHISPLHSLAVSPANFLSGLFSSLSYNPGLHRLAWFDYFFNLSNFSAEPDSGINKGNFSHHKHYTQEQTSFCQCAY